jgi:hypothetical protein
MGRRSISTARVALHLNVLFSWVAFAPKNGGADWWSLDVLGGRANGGMGHPLLAGSLLATKTPLRFLPLWTIPVASDGRHTARIRLFTECQMLCRVFFCTRQRSSLSSVKQKISVKTLGKETLCPVFYFWHSTKSLFVECFFDTRQKKFFAECFFTISKEFFIEYFFSTLGKNNLKITF